MLWRSGQCGHERPTVGAVGAETSCRESRVRA